MSWRRTVRRTAWAKCSNAAVAATGLSVAATRSASSSSASSSDRGAMPALAISASRAPTTAGRRHPGGGRGRARRARAAPPGQRRRVGRRRRPPAPRSRLGAGRRRDGRPGQALERQRGRPQKLADERQALGERRDELGIIVAQFVAQSRPQHGGERVDGAGGCRRVAGRPASSPLRDASEHSGPPVSRRPSARVVGERPQHRLAQLRTVVDKSRIEQHRRVASGACSSRASSHPLARSAARGTSRSIGASATGRARRRRGTDGAMAVFYHAVR